MTPVLARSSTIEPAVGPSRVACRALEDRAAPSSPQELIDRSQSEWELYVAPRLLAREFLP
jgi:hypothetical protein